ncbi:unnamed protein product [Moneuplotes crassus]|uniref:Cytochrome P450 n=1 Tax=Euplotes crassus TaxID=5936 RepID=A0AAD1XBX1_EUPCR|nr:unnamed protein product [Moneuplotes crassus]
MWSDLCWGLMKSLVGLGLGFGLYMAYLVIVKPLMFRKRFGEYSNVYVSEKFYPLVGDMNNEMQCIKEGKVHYSHYAERAEIVTKYDLQAKMEGIEPTIILISNEACKQFCNFMPNSIDRINNRKGFSEMLAYSMTVNSSTPVTMQRRKNFSSWVGLNSASKYIPRMIECCQETLDEMNSEEKSNLLHQINKLTFDVFTKILFGSDVEALVTKLYPYENPDGIIEDVTLREFLIRLSIKYADQLYNPITFIFPFFAKQKLINPYKRDYKNLQVFRAALSKILSTSQDKSTIGNKFFKAPGLSEDEGLDDLFSVMVGGTETTAHAMVSCLYFLKKYPHTLKKFREELVKCGFKKDCDYSKQYTVENIQNCTYLNSLVRETLRRDTVVPSGGDYSTNENIEICGVPIPKGTKLKPDLVSNHFAESQWLEPFEFVPERHDIESDFYKKSREAGKVEDVYSRRSFAHGKRNCPGQSFAIMQLKVVMAFFATHMEYSFEQKDLETEGIGFGLGSQFCPTISVSRI